VRMISLPAEKVKERIENKVTVMGTLPVGPRRELCARKKMTCTQENQAVTSTVLSVRAAISKSAASLRPDAAR